MSLVSIESTQHRNTIIPSIKKTTQLRMISAPINFLPPLNSRGEDVREEHYHDDPQRNKTDYFVIA